MVEPDFHKISNDSSIWKSELPMSNDLTIRMNNAFNVALEKLVKKNGTLELVVQTGEAFGRGIFYDFIQEKSLDWTMKKWLDTIIQDIFDPLGTSFNIAELTENSARSLITQYSFNENENETSIASFFNYGFIRGLLLSAFPDGELLMGDTLLLDVPLTEFTFKTNASNLDKIVRKNIKNLHTSKKNY